MILLTGASGFIGSHLLHKLQEVYGNGNIVALTSKPLQGFKYLLHNDYNFEENYFQKNNISIDIVIHAGAFTPKNAAQANNWQLCNSNIINTHNLLKALPATVKKIIFFSTLDVYGDTEVITETSPLGPVSLYGDAKLYCEKMVEAWAHSNGKIVQVLRVGHVYGPGEEQYEKIIPNTIKKLLNGIPMQVMGTGNDIRSFIYINDVVNAIVRSIGLDSYTGPINIVGEESISIKDLVMMLKKIAGDTKDIEYISSNKKVRNLYFNNSKMKELLCKEEYSLEKGLVEEWKYMSNLQ